MATVNYGLPTFDGENATKPIQFKSSITQGFQKIDEVMKANETAAGPVENLTSVVSGINTELNSIKSFLQSLFNSLEPLSKAASGAEIFSASANLPSGIAINQLHTVRVGLITVIFLSMYQSEMVSAGQTIAVAEGNIFNLREDQNYRFDGHRHIVKTVGGAYVSEGYARIMLSYHSSDNKTHLVTYDMNAHNPGERAYCFFCIPVTTILALPSAPSTLEEEAPEII